MKQNMPAGKDLLRLNGIRFYGHHGESAEERKLGGRFLADIELSFDMAKAAESDSIRDTVNYVEICKVVLEIGEQRQFKLIEAMAHTMAESILDLHPDLTVRVRLHKIGPPIPAIMESTEVEIERERL